MGKNLTRRKFIKLFFTVGTLLFLFKFLYFKIKKNKLIKVKMEDIPENGAFVIEDKRIGIFKLNGEIFVLDLKCTHLGCTVKVTPNTIKCPCHGSIFDLKGKPIKGPAKRPLKKYRFNIKNQYILINKI